MFGFQKDDQDRSGPPALTSLEQRKLVELEIRLTAMESAFVELCQNLRIHLDRINENTQILDKNMDSLAKLVVQPRKDILGDNQELN